MQNIDRWNILTQKITSPQSWVTFGFYWLISAALQRRVFYYGEGDGGRELFPNLYLGLIGPPGIGKGLILGLLSKLLKHHRYEKGEGIKTSIGSEKPCIFPVGADSVTFEELLVDITSNTRRVPKPDGKIYVHSSYAFILEELDSLFKKKTQDVVNFLKNAYDCKEYSYRTKHQGKFELRNLCMSFIAGATPDFLIEARKHGLFGQGFASRTLFLFEKTERMSRFHISDFDEEQQQCEKELLDWIRRLSLVFGPISYDEDTYKFLETWNRESLLPAKEKAPAKLVDYYSRKKVLILKLAAAVHYSESLDPIIPCNTFMRTIAMVDAMEKKLEIGLGSAGRNELHNYTKEIEKMIKDKKRLKEREVLLAFAVDLSVNEIKELIEELVILGIVRTEQEHGLRILIYNDNTN